MLHSTYCLLCSHFGFAIIITPELTALVIPKENAFKLLSPMEVVLFSRMYDVKRSWWWGELKHHAAERRYQNHRIHEHLPVLTSWPRFEKWKVSWPFGVGLGDTHVGPRPSVADFTAPASCEQRLHAATVLGHKLKYSMLPIKGNTKATELSLVSTRFASRAGFSRSPST